MNNRYPLKMRKLEGGKVSSVCVYTPEQEAQHVADGWAVKMPALPETAPATEGAAIEAIFSTLTALTARIDAQDAEIAELKARRGPGRPPKEKQ